jgi:hypothetical protein
MNKQFSAKQDLPFKQFATSKLFYITVVIALLLIFQKKIFFQVFDLDFFQKQQMTKTLASK